MRNDAPILMKRPLIEAAQAGLKTQTRRIEKAQPAPDATFVGFDDAYRPTFSDGTIWPARYAGPGALLWVKEPYSFGTAPEDKEGEGVASFDWGLPNIIICPTMDPARVSLTRTYKKRNSIHMYHWAARTFLRQAYQRIERLQTITPADAVAEGIPAPTRLMPNPNAIVIDQFKALWDSINEERGFAWKNDPFVRVIVFSYEPNGVPSGTEQR